MAETTYYVDTDATGESPDGSVGNPYHTLNDAEQAQDGDITAGNAVVFSCKGVTNADTAAVSITGWTTDTDSYIKVIAETANRHSGVWNTAKYRMVVADASAITVSEDYVRIEGLQIHVTSLAAHYNAPLNIVGQTTSANDVRVGTCLLRQAGVGTYREPCIYVADADTILTIWNCITYGSGGVVNNANAAIALSNAATVNIYGCTITGGYNGIYRAAGTVTVKNTYCGNTGNADFSGTITKSNCASEDTSAGTSDGCLSEVPYTTSTFASVTSTDATFLKVAGTGSSLYGAGATLTDDPPGSTALGVDIAGNSRS